RIPQSLSVFCSINKPLCLRGGCTLVHSRYMWNQQQVLEARIKERGLTHSIISKTKQKLGFNLFHAVCSLPVFPDLLNAIPAGLHVCIISFCGGVILFSSVASGFFFFNAFGRPFETLQGPMGLYLWTFISCMCSCMVMILFASEVKLHHLSERIANFNEVNFVFQTHSEHYDRCFWLFMLVFLLHGLNILLIRLAGIQFPFQETKEAELSGGAADLMY
uniref:Clarin 1 n=1 Tax=Anabas testudineus TaxID=64144 RepID=A0A7N6AUW1_ANATE